MKGFIIAAMLAVSFGAQAQNVINGIHIVETPDNVYTFSECDVFTFLTRTDFLSGSFTSRCQSFTVVDNTDNTSGFETRAIEFTNQSLVGANVFNFVDCFVIRMSFQLVNDNAAWFCFIES